MTPSTLLGPLLLAVATGQTPEPSPSPTGPVQTIYTVTPGISGFITFFVLALIGWLLFRSLVKHVRRVDQEVLRRERAAAEDGRAADAPVAPGDERTVPAGDERSVPSGDEPGEGPGR
ncbi:hypothetical protein [Georgenia sp. H159]|uniref:hypothetical protein n=1 Tax=Georgenia sp. H159 TaxID=3076115 RepID=UPI002D78CEFE|nr:hypothetical protein [Georgenia sp. H159]